MTFAPLGSFMSSSQWLPSCHWTQTIREGTHVESEREKEGRVCMWKEGTRKKGSPAYLSTRDHLGDEMVLIGSLYRDHLLTCQLSFAFLSFPFNCRLRLRLPLLSHWFTIHRPLSDHWASTLPTKAAHTFSLLKCCHSWLSKLIHCQWQWDLDFQPSSITLPFWCHWLLITTNYPLKLRSPREEARLLDLLADLLAVIRWAVWRCACGSALSSTVVNLL